MAQEAAFYEALGGGGFLATGATAGPWSDRAQHLGPVSALLVRALEACEPVPGTAIRRVSVDVLGPVPLGELEVRAEVLRPGRSVQLIAAELAAGGRVRATARAWRMVRGDSAPTGVAAAVAAGCTVIAVPCEVPLEPGERRVLLDSLESMDVPGLGGLLPDAVA